MVRWFCLSILFSLLILLIQPPLLFAQAETDYTHLVQPGDTWAALAYRFNLSPTSLMDSNGVINPQLQPIIGSYLVLHEASASQVRNGRLIRPFSGGLLETAASFGRLPWAISMQNDGRHPYSPSLFNPIFLPGGSNLPKELPVGIDHLSVSTLLARPGEALAAKARINSDIDVQINLDSVTWAVFRNDERMIGLGATGAFYGDGTPELRIQAGRHPLWTQRWLFEDKEWNYDRVTFPETSETSREAIEQERARLRSLWQQFTPEPLWSSSFTWPLQEFVEISSHYGARRSVNDGPFNTYHEGTDFSAYRGTVVYSPAGGKVALAEPLKVRGGAVILDHGFGIHTGYYHLSEISVQSGDMVKAGDKLGEVGSTGRSTGNHLHWDLLIGTTWVDAESWMDSDLANWISRGWNSSFPEFDHQSISQVHKAE